MGAGAVVGIVLGSIFGVFALLIVLGLAVGDDTNQADDEASILEVTAPAATESAKPAPAKPAAEKPAPAKPEPKPKRVTEYPSGDYLVGEDIPAGTYTSAGAEKGVFEFCSVTTEPTGDLTMPKIKSANADERIIITLAKEDGVVTVSGCEPLKPRR
ncbi:hypothetical protein [Streptomyces sp. B1I3]|uniref:hypothetical protein n=1 Tax=Streptomyces sp. B1I3 TaxID=3042264 RepID=UPI0027897EAE|nr:hypothetical protein [Streptomyces sp. B1I3]MDQ0798033.1 hypothetical protein [Streptomyces sp. B1I3]